MLEVSSRASNLITPMPKPSAMARVARHRAGATCRSFPSITVPMAQSSCAIERKNIAGDNLIAVSAPAPVLVVGKPLG